ncbi:MAG: ImmA/IrrE family metallo-endopeptidase [Actinobacteria bacterium]|nr:ImmA/IrrE family metallo-endopeptidase [Actinomycetota bacterium]
MSAGGARAAAALFHSERLGLARQAAGLRKNELAERVGVSAAAISQFEHGRANPSAVTLAKIALALGMPVEYFARDGRPLRQANAAAAFFRSLRSTRQRDRTLAAARAMFVWEVVHLLERHVELPEPAIPELSLPLGAEREAIEQAATAVRDAWGLPPGPVAHVVRLLEAHGAVVTQLRGLGREVDAFSCLQGRPIIVLWREKQDKARARFDAAHELGHLVLHSEAESGNKILEAQADAFAAAFLMPREYIYDQLPRRVDFRHLLELKMRWGVSLSALLYRSRTLGVIGESSYRRAMARMSSEGWRQDEPGDLGVPEAPTMLHAALELLRERGVTVETLASEARLPIAVVAEIVGDSPRPRLELAETDGVEAAG